MPKGTSQFGNLSMKTDGLIIGWSCRDSAKAARRVTAGNTFQLPSSCRRFTLHIFDLLTSGLCASSASSSGRQMSRFSLNQDYICIQMGISGLEFRLDFECSLPVKTASAHRVSPIGCRCVMSAGIGILPGQGPQLPVVGDNTPIS